MKEEFGFLQSRNKTVASSVLMKQGSGWEWHPQLLTGKCTYEGNW